MEDAEKRPPPKPKQNKTKLKAGKHARRQILVFFIPQIKEIVKNSKNLMSISDAYF